MKTIGGLFSGGTIFFALGVLDFCLNNFYETNITDFLPGFLSFFTPLIFSMIGLHLIYGDSPFNGLGGFIFYFQ